MAGIGDAPFIQKLAVPAVCLLIAFLSYFSQAVFRYATTLDPGPPSRGESLLFNALVLCLWLTYFRAATVDPGSYVGFRDGPSLLDAGGISGADGFDAGAGSSAAAAAAVQVGWCRKCRAPKPPRAHHCRTCGRCVPKMDHHCPWTGNCVSMTTFPHFLRFLAFANLSLWMLGRLLWLRFYALWEARDMPSYLGPSLSALAGLSVVALVWALTTLALGIMFASTCHSWALNCTTIEGWEMERHEAVLGRGGRDWWGVTGPDGDRVRFERVEFPYDIGVFANMAQAMGTRNPLLWLWPLAGHPAVCRGRVGAGWAWPENGFNRREGMWPPPDPDKYRAAVGAERPFARRNFEAELQAMEALGPDELKAAFQERQEQDLRRRKLRIVEELEEVEDDYSTEDDYNGFDDDHDHDDARERYNANGNKKQYYSGGAQREWTNTEGETLRDFGVDDDADDADQDVPIAELMRRRKAASLEKNKKLD